MGREEKRIYTVDGGVLFGSKRESECSKLCAKKGVQSQRGPWGQRDLGDGWAGGWGEESEEVDSRHDGQV